jgi:hypothetical protein
MDRGPMGTVMDMPTIMNLGTIMNMGTVMDMGTAGTGIMVAGGTTA